MRKREAYIVPLQRHRTDTAQRTESEAVLQQVLLRIERIIGSARQEWHSQLGEVPHSEGVEHVPT